MDFNFLSRDYLQQFNQTQKDEHLLAAVHLGLEEEVGALIQGGANIETADKNGDTALMLAALYGYTDIVLLLIKAKANIHSLNHQANTALILANAYKYLDIVNLLIGENPQLKTVNIQGNEALISNLSTEEQRYIPAFEGKSRFHRRQSYPSEKTLDEKYETLVITPKKKWNFFSSIK